jgi:glycosyltransferase involved in cell wall biosynthesis
MILGVVIPLFKSEKTIKELLERLIFYFETNHLSYHIILVEDGCPNKSSEAILDLLNSNKNIICLKLSRNFGQHQAISAGLELVKGDWIVVMDADLQDLPENIGVFLDTAIRCSFDVVVGLRKKRKDNIIRKTESYLFYKALHILTGQNINQGISNFGIYNRKVVDKYNDMKELYRSFGMFIIWLGFKRIEIPIEHGQRNFGKSSYTFVKKINLALDTILSFSDRPLKLIIGLGIFIFSLAFSCLTFVICKNFINSKPLLGWTSLILMISFGTGLLLIAIGVVGLYVGKTFMETKKRPLYVIDEIINNDSL